MDVFHWPSISDVNECSRGTSQCSSNATCTDTIGSYTCSCNAGFSGDGFYCQGRGNVGRDIVELCYECTDINECNGNNSCSLNANCNNTDGSYTCSCRVGFEGDGINCTSG